MLNNIGSLVGGKVLEAVKLLGGVHKEIEDINEQLETIQFDINGADRMYASTEQEKKGDNEMKRKVKDLREVALRIEDVSEDYMIFQQQQPQNDLGCIAVLYAAANFFKTIIPRLRICYEIQDIKTRIREVNERPDLQIQPFLPSQHALRRKALYVEEDDVVGFEAPKKELIGLLNETQPKRTVIIVVGMGGQGKTTLAKTVYDKVIGDFDCHVWITVSQTYKIEDLLRTMLKKFNVNRNNVSEMDLESLTNEVRKYLSQKRYVIFFDDVWSKDFWSDIESAMRDDKNRSRIMITTRDMDVAKFCKISSIHIYNLQCLSSQESMKLFCKKAFQNEPGGICPSDLEEISSKIVEKCQGLPLAIVAIGGLVACSEKSELQRLCKTLNMIYELDKNPNSTGITNILGLSYDALSYRLKSCFMYFGIYPEDCEVNSKRLIRQWIAEGFVKSNERYETLEEVADQYLQELIQRNLVKVSSFSMNGKPKGCHVHDLLHDMILVKIKDLGFCHFFGDDHSMISGKILRLQIPYNANHLKDDITKMSFIRSIHSLGYKDLPGDFLGMIVLKSTRLKLLDFTYRPNHIASGNFIHLRYLKFVSSANFDLANSICKMQNLETLDLMGLGSWSMEINKLKKLRHLHTLVPMIVMGGVRGLESLQTLWCVDAKEWEEELFEELKELKQLRRLGIKNVNQNYMRNLCYSINNLQHLEKLDIEVLGSIDLDCISTLPTLQKLTLAGGLERFEEWIPMHRNLVKLTLLGSNLSDDPMKSLAHLPNLLSLFLRSAYKGETLHFINGGFQKLQKLHLRQLSNLNSIHIGEGALPSLKELKLEFIAKLKEVPYGMDQLGKLQVLYIVGLPGVFTIRIKESVWINKNVPNVIIYFEERRNFIKEGSQGASLKQITDYKDSKSKDEDQHSNPQKMKLYPYCGF